MAVDVLNDCDEDINGDDDDDEDGRVEEMTPVATSVALSVRANFRSLSFSSLPPVPVAVSIVDRFRLPNTPTCVPLDDDGSFDFTS
jgi:hypothetical protein